jgi:hypothetical protein
MFGVRTMIDSLEVKALYPASPMATPLGATEMTRHRLRVRLDRAGQRGIPSELLRVARCSQ